MAVFSVRAYSKMIIHAMKYPHCAVNGVFLADKKKNAENGGVISISDCIPLFHINLGLTPMLEVALIQIENYCKTSGLVIAGYYQANENFQDCHPDFIACRIAEKVNENFSDSCLVMIDNQQLSLNCDDVAFQLYQSIDNKWRPKDRNCIHLEQGERALEVTSALLHSRAYYKLVDFENHLDNLTLRWRNDDINAEISRCQ